MMNESRNRYKLSITFEAADDVEAQKMISSGRYDLGAMTIQNLGQRKTLRLAAALAGMLAFWIGVAVCVWRRLP
jgi:hypothetical protein